MCHEFLVYGFYLDKDNERNQIRTWTMTSEPNIDSRRSIAYYQLYTKPIHMFYDAQTLHHSSAKEQKSSCSRLHVQLIYNYTFNIIVERAEVEPVWTACAVNIKISSRTFSSQGQIYCYYLSSLYLIKK